MGKKENVTKDTAADYVVEPDRNVVFMATLVEIKEALKTYADRPMGKREKDVQRREEIVQSLLEVIKRMILAAESESEWDTAGRWVLVVKGENPYLEKRTNGLLRGEEIPKERNARLNQEIYRRRKSSSGKGEQHSPRIKKSRKIFGPGRHL